jgi:protein-S-isoprenylcysteine O-methyltransferase
LMYTAALLSSTIEFWTRFLLFPSFRSSSITIFGLGLVLLAQTCRSLAMATCGESFNHRIQTSKKKNHVLVTHGM